jgi:hypothetical protein
MGALLEVGTCLFAPADDTEIKAAEVHQVA